MLEHLQTPSQPPPNIHRSDTGLTSTLHDTRDFLTYVHVRAFFHQRNVDSIPPGKQSTRRFVC